MPTITCIHCRHESPRHLKEPIAFGCPHCGKIMARDSVEQSWQAAKPMQVQPYYIKPGWLRPGAQLRYYDKVYTVFSIMVYHSNWEEWDNEDSTWERGVCDNEEWYAIASDGSELCLEIDDGLHFIRQEVSKPSASVCQRFKSYSKDCIERGDFHLRGFEGEDDEPLDRRHYKYMVLDDNGDLYAEWLPDDFDNTAKFYSYRYVSATELERMRVRDENELEDYSARLPHQSFSRNVLGVALLCFLVFWLGSMATGKEALVTERIGFSAYRPGDSLQLQPKSLGTFRLEPNRAYQVELSCELPQNAAAGFDLEIVNTTDGAVVNSFGCEFATETGRDDEGQWTESTLQDYFNFQSETGGTFEAFVMPARTSFSDMPLSGGYLTFKILPITLSRYFFISFLLLTGAFLVMQWKLENTKVVLNLGSGTWLHAARDGMSKTSKG